MITQNDFLASERFEYEKFFTCRYEPASSKGIVGFVFYRDGFGDLVKVQEVKDFDKQGFCVATPHGLQRVEFSDCSLIEDAE